MYKSLSEINIKSSSIIEFFNSFEFDNVDFFIFNSGVLYDVVLNEYKGISIRDLDNFIIDIRIIIILKYPYTHLIQHHTKLQN